MGWESERLDLGCWKRNVGIGKSSIFWRVLDTITHTCIGILCSETLCKRMVIELGFYFLFYYYYYYFFYNLFMAKKDKPQSYLCCHFLYFLLIGSCRYQLRGWNFLARVFVCCGLILSFGFIMSCWGFRLKLPSPPN